MHDTALTLGQMFFETYVKSPARILDVGSQDVNGSLRRFAPAGSSYVGADLAAGAGVDVVLRDPTAMPFEAGAFDVVVSTSCFEHDPMFWLTFTEILRVTREGAHIYINAPSNGNYHRFPADNWRFYPDAGLALCQWGRRQGYNVSLVESFIAPRAQDIWNDCVMVFTRATALASGARLSERVRGAMNVRSSAAPETIGNHTRQTEDQRLLETVLRTLQATKAAAPQS